MHHGRHAPAPRFPHGCVASPHHLASSAGQAVLASGGNAVDAAVAANLVLGTVTPYHCGAGGDLFAIVWTGEAHGYASDGRAPAGATPDAVAVASGTGDMPVIGGLTVTVPGAVQGWFDLLQRFGSRSFGDLAQTAIAYARDGFAVSDHAMGHFSRGAQRYAERPDWMKIYGSLAAGDVLVQPALAATLTAIAEDGPEAFYRGDVAASIVRAVTADGSTMTVDDLAGHEGEWVDPLSGRFRDVDVLELPPPTQGVTALTALAVLDTLGTPPADPAERTHLAIEASRAAMADRGEYVTDPDHMSVRPEALYAPDRAAAIAASIDPTTAAAWPPARPAPGGTAYLCATDRDGMLVSLIQSNFMGFGSGVHATEAGINLQNRGAQFSLDADDVNVIAPGKRTLHTLIPSLVTREDEPILVLGTMGGDSQPQIHQQLLARLLDDGDDLQAAIDAPRWIVEPVNGTVSIEARAGDEVIDGLRDRGHEVNLLGDFEHAMGHANAIAVDPHGYRGATDPRAEGAVVGH